MRVFLLTAAWVSLLSAVGVRADEVTLADGKRLLGTLEMDGKGRLRFDAPGQPAPPSLAGLDIRLTLTPLPPFRGATAHQVTLAHDQRLTGELLELSEKELWLRTAWSDRLTVPRRAIIAVAHPPGWVTFHDDDFEDEPKTWKRTGAPARSNRQQTSGQYGLLLDRPGQAAEFLLAEPLRTGRAGINFHDPSDATGFRWLIEAEFGPADQPWTARVVLAGDSEDYQLDGPWKVASSDRVPRTKGWHRLTLRFDHDYLLVGVDDHLLGSSDKQGPVGPLRMLRLLCTAGQGGKSGRGEVFFDDFSLARAVNELPHRVEDATQDEVWLLSGDQLFGSVVRADRRTIELQGKAGSQTLPWGQVRGLFLRRQTLPPQTTEGEHVRVWLHPAGGGEPDQLEGVLKALDARRLVLYHAVLGELAFERGRVKQLRSLFRGRRVELDNAAHHLGDPSRPVPNLQPVRAEGLSLRRSFRLDALPTEARLVVQTVGLKGPSDGIGAALGRGEPRTELVLNGQIVDYLNRHAGGSSEQPRRIDVILPRRSLRTGDNALEIRQTAAPDRVRYESCIITSLALELKP